MLLPVAQCHETISWFNIVGTALLIGLLIYAFYNKYHTPKQTNNNLEMEHIYKIKGMNCNHCKMSVEKNLVTVAGVKSVKVDLKEQLAYVDGNPDSNEVEKLISELGFECMGRN